MKRLFLAIPIKTNDNGFIPLLDGLKRQLAHEKRINWVKPDNIHLTLKFIGNTPNEDIPKIIDGVGEMLKNHKSFTMDFNRTGIFGSRYAPRVLWLGMQNTPQELYDLEEDTLKENAAWCGTFNLIWNDLILCCILTPEIGVPTGYSKLLSNLNASSFPI